MFTIFKYVGLTALLEDFTLQSCAIKKINCTICYSPSSIQNKYAELTVLNPKPSCWGKYLFRFSEMNMQYCFYTPILALKD